ncbi:hypothetical protein PR048_033536 [Dryococelus australis]|uniref:Uncharacterized protein n=1 Tax=Dryococelus australis TaxID=614101 RepID=A0ABQ9G1S9_9NEOP|nr:hypothetical protein PR048_033536 [Dryococelus australis]
MAGLNIVKLPESVDLQSPTARKDWEIFKGDFENYLIATGQDECPGKIKIALFKNMLGSQGHALFETFVISPEDRLVYSRVKEAYKTFVAPKTNPLYKHLFHQSVQLEGETFDHFLTECHWLVKTYGYDRLVTQEENMLVDRIVQGISDATLQEALLRMENATHAKVAAHCRLVEQIQEQAKDIQPKNYVQVRSNASVDFVAAKVGSLQNPELPIIQCTTATGSTLVPGVKLNKNLESVQTMVKKNVPNVTF